MKKNTNLTKLYLMVIALPRGKKEIIGDVLEKYDVTAYLSTVAKGSLNNEYDRRIMFCIIKEDNIKDAILNLEDRFAKFKDKISMVYTIPLDSIIGVSSYMALTNGGK